jgi:uncharacterized protein
MPQAHIRSALLRVSETLAIGLAGGAALGTAGFPAGWLSGAILAVAVAALAGRPMLVPPRLTQCVFVILGMSLGAAVTPQTLARLATWPASLAILAVAMTCTTLAVMAYLRLVHGWDRLSALFAASPGALAQALALAAEMGADLRAVAMVQSVRLLVLAVGLPVGLAAFGFTGAPPASGTPIAGPQSIVELAALTAAAVAGAIAAYRLRLPGGLIVGAMAVSGVLHGSGLITVGLPPAAAIATFIVLGSAVGARFAGTDIWLLRRLALVGLGALAVGTTVACAFAIAAAVLLSLHGGDVIVAYAPGAIEAMTTLAFALHLDPAFVGVHHVARFTFVSLLIPVIIRALRRAPEKKGERAAPPDKPAGPA